MLVFIQLFGIRREDGYMLRLPRQISAAAAFSAIFVLMGCLTSSQATVARGVAEKFCQRPVLKNYESQLRGLSPTSPFPILRKLPFAPEAVVLSRSALPPNDKHVIVRGGSFGYLLHGPVRGIDVDWNITVEVVRIGDSNTTAGMIFKREALVHNIGSVASGIFVVKLSTRPGIYSYRMTFKGSEGQTLAAYDEYLSVVQPTEMTKLEVNSRVMPAGNQIAARFGNLGSLGVNVLRRLTLERKVGANWRGVKLPPARGFAEQEVVGGGRTSSCFRTTIPKASPPGVYRLAARFETLRTSQGGRKPVRWASAAFRVH